MKELLTKEDIKKLSRFSNIILNCKHYVITNLNNVEGCQLLATSDNILACKIPCLPNHTYDIFMYYTSDHWINFMAFSFDYDSKEYVTNLSGFKYTNNEENMKPAFKRLYNSKIMCYNTSSWFNQSWEYNFAHTCIVKAPDW